MLPYGRASLVIHESTFVEMRIPGFPSSFLLQPVGFSTPKLSIPSSRPFPPSSHQSPFLDFPLNHPFPSSETHTIILWGKEAYYPLFSSVPRHSGHTDRTVQTTLRKGLKGDETCPFAGKHLKMDGLLGASPLDVAKRL